MADHNIWYTREVNWVPFRPRTLRPAQLCRERRAAVSCNPQHTSIVYKILVLQFELNQFSVFQSSYNANRKSQIGPITYSIRVLMFSRFSKHNNRIYIYTEVVKSRYVIIYNIPVFGGTLDTVLLGNDLDVVLNWFYLLAVLAVLDPRDTRTPSKAHSRRVSFQEMGPVFWGRRKKSEALEKSVQKIEVRKMVLWGEKY